MRVLLASTYELGHQPLHVASPAAALLAASHEVRAMDLSVDPLDDDAVRWAEAVGVSVPMHTAMRLALPLARRIRASRPDLPIAFYGLYGAVGSDRVVGSLVDRAVAGEYEGELVAWVEELERGDRTPGLRLDLGRAAFHLPARHLLPDLSRYAHLQVGTEHRLVGYVEASHGCRHRCKHCPLPSVYDGRFRVVGVDEVLADVEQLVRMGARHVSFGDPDFLNGPAYAARVIEAVHSAFPELTFDCTVKVEHLRERADLLPVLRGCNVLFLVSAFETVSDRILRILDKGHTVEDMGRVVRDCRREGIDIRPSWLPFTPWTSPQELLGIFRFLDDLDLLAATDPVQLTIRLLVPDGSLLLTSPQMQAHLDGYDPELLSHRWRAEHPHMDSLQLELAQIAAASADAGGDPLETVVTMWRRVIEQVGGDASEAQIPAGATSGRPRLTEPWFC